MRSHKEDREGEEPRAVVSYKRTASAELCKQGWAWEVCVCTVLHQIGTKARMTGDQA